MVPETLVALIIILVSYITERLFQSNFNLPVCKIQSTV